MGYYLLNKGIKEKYTKFLRLKVSKIQNTTGRNQTRALLNYNTDMNVCAFSSLIANFIALFSGSLQDHILQLLLVKRTVHNVEILIRFKKFCVKLFQHGFF